MENIYQTAGWIGTALVVLAYLLVSTGHISARSKRYQLLNLFGAIGVGMNVFHQNAWPALSLQVIWGLIAVVSLFRSKRGQ